MPLRTPDMEAMLRRWGSALQHSAPTLAAAVLTLLIAWLLAELTWSLLPRPKVAESLSAPAPVATAHRVDAGRIADQHLFGTTAAGGNLTDAPDTTLALTLHGIVAGKRASDSRALIVANGDEEPYAIGATLPGGAVIRAIFPDRVMLERGGQVEALRLPKTDTSGAVTASAEQPQPENLGPSPPSAPPLPQNLGELRQAISQNPQRLMDVIRAMPVQQGGKLTGYRIYPAGNTPLFAQLGLHPGDVVTAVNGIPLTDPAQSMRILSSLKTSEQVSITLLRNGQQQTQVLQMPPESGAGQEPDSQ